MRAASRIAGILLTGGWIGLATAVPARASETVLVEAGSRMTWLANTSEPGLGLSWTQPGFDDAAWDIGTYGAGYETGIGAAALIATHVPPGSASVYTRASFPIPDPALVRNLFLGMDYDDGVVVWLNGVEVWRSPEMPPGAPAWNAAASLHESSNAVAPRYDPLVDVSSAGRAALLPGMNVLAVGVWNSLLPSSDLVVVPRLSMNREAAVTRGPYLQSGSHDRVTIRWRTAAPVVSTVSWGTSPGSLEWSLGGSQPVTEHEMTITGLAPETTYHYAVGTSEDVHRFRTAPAPGQGGPVRIWVLGDSGTADTNARAVRDAFTRHTGERLPDLWLMLGDNAYPDGTQGQYQAAVFDMYPETLASSVLWPTLGNHDGHTADSARQTGPYYDIFTLPRQAEAGGVPSGTEAYYSFDHGPIHFICLDSYETDRSPTGAMMTWLREDALSTTADWLIAFWHHPPYSKGSHDSDREVELIQMREQALPILEAAGVDLVLAGHSHSYERSFLLDGHHGASGTLAPSMIRDAGDGREEGDGAYAKPAGGAAPHEGAVYVVAGSSGTTGGGALNHPAMFLSLNALGSLVLDVDRGRLDGVFLDSQGAVRDSFTVLKEAPNSPPVPRAEGSSRVECSSPQGALVSLDGTGSHDPDTGDRIVSHEWFEDFGAPGQTLLATGETAAVLLGLGSHALTLRVTDARGATSTGAITVVVQDTTAPHLELAASPRLLWPPDGRMEPVHLTYAAVDTCGGAAVTLFDVSSSEPEEADDIQGAEPGTPDGEILLRARRPAGAPARVYTLSYRAADPSGNTSFASIEVVVPHDRRPAAR